MTPSEALDKAEHILNTVSAVSTVPDVKVKLALAYIQLADVRTAIKVSEQVLES